MSVVERLRELGGVSTRRRLVQLCSRAEVDRALAEGELVALARGRYALPVVDDALAAACSVTGVVSHLSAALHHGWAVLVPPELPHVTVPSNRKSARAAGVAVIHWATLDDDDVDGSVTSPDRTLLDCLRHLPADEALAVADSALREGYPRPRLLAVARDARGRGSVAAREVAAAADGRAANPFESRLRAIARRVSGLTVVPQISIREPTFLGRCDLVDERLRIVLEADSFAWHGDRTALHRDTRRYNRLVAHGWLVLRFSWEDVVLHPAVVEEVLTRVVAERENLLCPGCRRA